MDQDQVIRKLSAYQHSEVIEAIQCLGKSKLKTGKERYVLLEQAKIKLYPFSGDENLLQAINNIAEIQVASQNQ